MRDVKKLKRLDPDEVRAAYSKALDSLPVFGHATSRSSLSAKQLSVLLPHIPPDGIEYLLTLSHEKNRMTPHWNYVSVATPPLGVSTVYHRLVIEEGLVYYSSQGRSNQRGQEAYIQDALDFAAEVWPDDLTPDNWLDVVTFNVIHPSRGIFDGLVRQVSVGIKGFIADVDGYISDDSIVSMAADPRIAKEMHVWTTKHFNGERPVINVYNCANDGHGIEGDRCSYCKASVRGGIGAAVRSFPLPSLVLDYLAESRFRLRQGPLVSDDRRKK